MLANNMGKCTHTQPKCTRGRIGLISAIKVVVMTTLRRHDNAAYCCPSARSNALFPERDALSNTENIAQQRTEIHFVLFCSTAVVVQTARMMNG